jgi:hypothetical protein
MGFNSAFKGLKLYGHLYRSFDISVSSINVSINSLLSYYVHFSSFVARIFKVLFIPVTKILTLLSLLISLSAEKR